MLLLLIVVGVLLRLNNSGFIQFILWNTSVLSVAVRCIHGVIFVGGTLLQMMHIRWIQNLHFISIVLGVRGILLRTSIVGSLTMNEFLTCTLQCIDGTRKSILSFVSKDFRSFYLFFSLLRPLICIMTSSLIQIIRCCHSNNNLLTNLISKLN